MGGGMILTLNLSINNELVNNYYNKDAIIDDENIHELLHMDNEESKSNDESECDESTEEYM
jgi:hypothetical protein